MAALLFFHSYSRMSHSCRDSLSVSGHFLDSAKSRRHCLRSTCRQANHCPFLVFFVDYFLLFYAGDSLRCPRCFLPPVTTSSKYRSSSSAVPSSNIVFRVLCHQIASLVSYSTCERITPAEIPISVTAEILWPPLASSEWPQW